MKLEFQEKEVRPGHKVNLTIRAPPMSYVGVVAVDQSVYIQQEKNQLTTYHKVKSVSSCVNITICRSLF